MIPESFIQDLLNRVDLVNVIDRLVPLKKTGSNLTACCPFHHEKSPSFSVSPTKQFYHCFGCGAHGDAISFVTKYQGLTFVDAVHQLAGEVGLQVPKDEKYTETNKPIANAAGIQDVLQKASDFYRQQLKINPKAIDYLKSRGFTGEIAAKFSLGYAPGEWQNLTPVLPDYTTKDVQDSGLTVTSEKTDKLIYDRFRDRVMFPIHNQTGVIVGFGGRILDPKTAPDSPKYINSPETPLFQKGNELYGLFHAKKAIHSEDKVLVVEGYTDVVALSQHGVEYAVATLGTATTAAHINKLKRYAEEIVFCFDGDSAGRKAAWRATLNALPALTDKIRLGFLFLPDGHDPDSYVREFSKEAFELLVKNAMPLSEYIIRTLTDENPMKTAEDQIKFGNEAGPVINLIHAKFAPKMSILLKNEIGRIAGLSPNQLDAELRRIAPAVKAAGASSSFSPRQMMVVSNERKLTLILMLNASVALADDAHLITGEQGEKPSLKIVLQTCATNKTSNTAALLRALKEQVNEEFLKELERDLNLMEELIDLESAAQNLRNQIKASTVHNKLSDLIASLKGKSLSELTPEEREALTGMSAKKQTTITGKDT